MDPCSILNRLRQAVNLRLTIEQTDQLRQQLIALLRHPSLTGYYEQTCDVVSRSLLPGSHGPYGGLTASNGWDWLDAGIVPAVVDFLGGLVWLPRIPSSALTPHEVSCALLLLDCSDAAGSSAS